MKQYIVLLIALLIASAILCAENPIAVASKLKGTITYTHNDKESPAKTGQSFFNKDQIQSGDNSFAAIQYVDNSALVKLFPNSILRISATADGKSLKKQDYLKEGTVFAKVNKAIKGGYRLETPTTVISVKGTEFFSEVDGFGNTNVYTVEGTVEVTNKSSGKTELVEKGHNAASGSDGNLELHENSSGDNSWIDGLNNSGGNGNKQIYRIQIKDKDGNLKYIEFEAE